MLWDEMKKDKMLAMKEKNEVAKEILSVVLNKVMLLNIELKEKGKEIADADVIQILQKMVKDLNEDSENYKRVGNQKEADNILAQRDYISKYIPQLMGEDEIRAIIADLDDKSMGNIMRTFKSQYAGKVDMALVNKIARG